MTPRTCHNELRRAHVATDVLRMTLASISASEIGRTRDVKYERRRSGGAVFENTDQDTFFSHMKHGIGGSTFLERTRTSMSRTRTLLHLIWCVCREIEEHIRETALSLM